MDIAKVAAIGIIGVLFAVQFKQGKSEYSIYIGMVICMIIFFYISSILAGVSEQILGLKAMLPEQNKYFTILMKIMGITYLCEFSAGICKDAGYSNIGSQIEIFGKLSVILAGLPVFFAVIETIQGFLK